jgi:hypothetical protein
MTGIAEKVVGSLNDLPAFTANTLFAVQVCFKSIFFANGFD